MQIKDEYQLRQEMERNASIFCRWLIKSDINFTFERDDISCMIRFDEIDAETKKSVNIIQVRFWSLGQVSFKTGTNKRFGKKED